MDQGDPQFVKVRPSRSASLRALDERASRTGPPNHLIVTPMGRQLEPVRLSERGPAHISFEAKPTRASDRGRPKNPSGSIPSVPRSMVDGSFVK